MCLIVFDWRPSVTDGPLLTLVANRDEAFCRTAEPLHWWNDAPDVLAGRDLQGGGTWLGVTRGGRFAALTNYRAPHEMRDDAPTRGALVAAWLTGVPGAPLDYLHEVARSGKLYNGFNLIVGDFRRHELGWYCNHHGAPPPALLAEGTHGISNAILDTPWPKLTRKRAELARLIAARPPASPGALIDMMRDPQQARDDELPSTGLSPERERALSAAFIELPDYGTRGTTALRVSIQSAQIHVEVTERSDDDGSHQIVRPGHYERREQFVVTRGL